MQVRFLLGPAGSGKTFRCLQEIRASLLGSPDGPPLVLLAPKQATFQLERQLLADVAISGFTRLQILSFDRLAEFVFAQLNIAVPNLLSMEGSLMVLRALLRRHEDELKLLRGSARRTGFAQELAGQLGELQQHQFGQARLRKLAADESLRRDLRDKLLDLALLSEKYAEWQKEHNLRDANCLLDIAAELLQTRRRNENIQPPPSAIQRPKEEVAVEPSLHLLIDHLWLDGFAEMTPQEHALLAAIVPFCRQATLAFCLETEPTPSSSWLSIWSAIGKTFQRCRDQVSSLPGCEVKTEILPRKATASRFPEHSATTALESGWALPVATAFESPNLASQVSVTACATPEAEAAFAAREILKFVQSDKRRRFRDCAVLVRNLESYHHPIARIFRRYDIPFFLDRRESVSHHPLAELTRSALRTVAYDWLHDDWFATLKSGFTPLPETDIDRLENMALEFGWRGKKWLEPLPDDYCERLRQRIFSPFDRLFRSLQKQKLTPTGPQLADAIDEFWRELKVEEMLEEWSMADVENGSSVRRNAALHQTVYDQMAQWLDNVRLAFSNERLPLREWLPILDAGLAALTVGVIPPALDEVLVGAIDRARNPDLKFTLLLGVNESVFPAAPAVPAILTASDREELDKQNASLGVNLLDQISRERYLGYIACTRASEKLALTYALQGTNGRALNPSPLVAQLRRTFPQLAIEEYSDAAKFGDARHPNELVSSIFNHGRPADEPWLRPLMRSSSVESLTQKLKELREPSGSESLSPGLAEKIYGKVLKSSVSKLEEFAQCPFRFFIHSGLRAEERKTFELDARERGSFQHEILKQFHDELVAENKRWRDITPIEARERIGKIAEVLAADYREGLLRVDDRSRFTARALTLALQDFVETLVAWMRGQYCFDPAKAETGFGLETPGLPAWQIDLGDNHALALRGRVDRIDLCEAGDRYLAVVMDYKSGVRKLEKIFIEHGIQLQLLAYLAAVRQWPADFFQGRKIVPAGVFYVNLRGHFEGGASRTEVLAAAETARRQAYRHSGRFNWTFLEQLDHSRARDQFNYMLNNDGTVRSNSAEALAHEDFNALIDQVEAQLKRIGKEIYSGAAKVDPYKKGGATACDYCDYRSVCRIDDWTHEFRELRAAAKSKEASDET